MSTKDVKDNALEHLKNAIVYSVYILVVWGFYRLLFKLPEEVEEFVVKPLVWLIPLFHYLRKEKAKISSVGITHKNLFSSIYLSLFLGFLFLSESLVINYFKYGAFNFNAFIGKNTLFISLAISLATAISEELAFRGYILTRIEKAVKNKTLAITITTILWAIIHIPVIIFVLKLNFAAAIIQLLLTSIFGVGSAIIFMRTRNITSSVILHVLWEWPIILFR